MYRGRRTDRKKLHEIQAARGTSSDTLLAGLGQLDERVVLWENLDPVCHFHDVRADHAVDTRALDARNPEEGLWKPAQGVGDSLLQMDRDAGPTVGGQPTDEVVRILSEDGAVIPERRRVELLVRHLPADAPVVAVVHGPEVPPKARSVRVSESGWRDSSLAEACEGTRYAQLVEHDHAGSVRVCRGPLVQEVFGGVHRVHDDEVHSECIESHDFGVYTYMNLIRISQSMLSNGLTVFSTPFAVLQPRIIMRSRDVAHIAYKRQPRRPGRVTRTTHKATIQNEERDGKQEGDHDNGGHLGLGKFWWGLRVFSYLPSHRGS